MLLVGLEENEYKWARIVSLTKVHEAKCAVRFSPMSILCRSNLATTRSQGRQFVLIMD